MAAACAADAAVGQGEAPTGASRADVIGMKTSDASGWWQSVLRDGRR
jgi:hypothetical protein